MSAVAQAPSPRLAAAWDALAAVLDPEVPALTLVDLGIVRGLEETADGVAVVLTPTYSGCPATEAIEADVRAALAPFGRVSVTLQRAPAWTTDWISADGRRKLRDYGIAPPGPASEAVLRFHPRVACPRCAATQTERLSAFGSTACKSLYRCRACGEPFEYFKPI
ncbi:MAG: phenylacetate-CoA oxygenase subunit PaaJ [Pelomonas sp.]|nr:phenylacetate-CoA oxygenase subunit PaaJ [Roseateles sp.]